MILDALHWRSHARTTDILPVLEELTCSRPISRRPEVLPFHLSTHWRLGYRGHRVAALGSVARASFQARSCRALHVPLIPPLSAVRDLTAEQSGRPLLRPQWQVTPPRLAWSVGAVVPGRLGGPVDCGRPGPVISAGAYTGEWRRPAQAAAEGPGNARCGVLTASSG